MDSAFRLAWMALAVEIGKKPHWSLVALRGLMVTCYFAAMLQAGNQKADTNE